MVNYWLTGATTSMDYGYATMIKKALGYRVDWLMRGKGPKRDSEQDAAMVKAEPANQPDAPVVREQQPAQDAVLFLVHVTFGELRKLSIYRKRKDYRPMFNKMAKTLADAPDEGL